MRRLHALIVLSLPTVAVFPLAVAAQPGVGAHPPVLTVEPTPFTADDGRAGGGVGAGEADEGESDGDGWTDPVALPVDGPADDLLPSFSADGRTLFFASDRGAAEDAYSVYYADWNALVATPL